VVLPRIVTTTSVMMAQRMKMTKTKMQALMTAAVS
jgi:hypothetical protein